MPKAKPARPVTKAAANVPAENNARSRACGPSMHTPSLPRCAWASRGQGNAWPVTAEGWLPTTYGDHHTSGTRCQLCDAVQAVAVDCRDRFDNRRRPKIDDEGFPAHLSSRSYL